MNKLIIAVALCAALAACKKDDTAAPADTAPAADTAAPAADAAMPADPAADAAMPATDAAAPMQAGLPQECEDYINRMKACVEKSGGNAAVAQYQAALDQNRAQWEATPDKAALIPACKQANDSFAQMAAALKCE